MGAKRDFIAGLDLKRNLLGNIKVNNLKTIKYIPSDPKRMVVFLHGYGADANDLAGLFPYFKDQLSDAVLVSIESPFVCDVYAGGRQWYPLDDAMRIGFHTQNETAIDATLSKTMDVREVVLKELKNTVEALAKAYRIDPQNIILTGFSQGAGMALALSLMIDVAQVISYSGLLFPPYEGNTPLLMFHGESDSVLPFSYAQMVKEKIEKVRHLNFVPLRHTDHTIPMEAIEKSIEWIKK